MSNIIEIVLYGVRFNYEHDCIEEDNDNPEDFGVYVRVQEKPDFAPLRWKADLPTHVEAECYALGLQSVLNVPIIDRFAIQNGL